MVLNVAPGKHVHELLSGPHCLFEHCAGWGEGAGAGVGEDYSYMGEDHRCLREGGSGAGGREADADISRLQQSGERI